MKMLDMKKNKIVKKHNDLIKASGVLSNTAQKMLAMIIGMIRTDDTDFQEYAVKTSAFNKAVGSTSRSDKQACISAARELMENPFVIDDSMFTWISKANWKKYNGYIVFSIHPDLKPYLLNLKKNFTSYDIVNILKLRGEYSPRIYEYFTMKLNMFRSEYKKQHGRYASSYSLEMSVDELRGQFAVPDSYKYSSIKERILEKAKTQLETYTDIKFSYSEIKMGNRVVSISFSIEENRKPKQKHLATRRAFIAYVRKNLVNKEILKATDKRTGEKYTISVSNKGILYDLQGSNFDSKRSDEIWSTLYEMAKRGELESVK